MSATTPHLETRPGPGPSPGRQRRHVSVQPISTRQNALEGAAAVLCAVVAMATVSAVALSLLDAESFGSLSSLTMTLTAMAVGGSVSAGSGSSADTDSMGGLAGMFGGGGGMSASMSGAVDAVPLGVTLVGTIVLWIAFSRRMRKHQFSVRELGVRAAGAGGAALLVFAIVAGLAQGTANLSSSLMGGMGAGGGQQPGGGAGGGGGMGGMPGMGGGGGMPGMGGDSGGMPGFPGMGGESGGMGGFPGMGGDSGGMPGFPGMGGESGGMPGMGGGSGGGMPGMGGGSGGDMTSSLSSMTYHVGMGSSALGAVVWVAVVLAVGCLISRRVRLPLSGALSRLRPTWAPSISSLVRTVLTIAFIPLVILAVVGGVVGGQAAGAAGLALLAAPNALAVFLSLGVGSSWKIGMHPVQSEGGSSGGMPGMGGGSSGGMGGMPGMGGGSSGGMGGMPGMGGGSGGGMPGMGGGSGGMGGMGGQMADRTEYLRSISLGGLPLWLGAFLVTVVILLACAYRAARTTNPAHLRPLHAYRGPLAQHIGLAERFGIVTAVALGGAVWLATASGSFGISMMGSQMGGMQAELSGSVLGTAVFGLLVGGLAGFAGSMLSTVRGERAAR